MEYWYSWLSRTTLDTPLRYEYSLIFTENELQKEDIIYFNHEFLQSLGITTAKHRLEILKLVQKELGKRPNGFGKLISAFKKTKKLFTKWTATTSSHKNSANLFAFEQYNCGALRRINSAKEQKKFKKNHVTKSGPLERGMLEEMMMAEKWLSLSGPLNEKFYQEKRVPTNRSPTRYYGQINDKMVYYGSKSPGVCKTWQEKRRSPSPSPSPLANHCYGEGNASPWSLMFQNMKPT